MKENKAGYNHVHILLEILYIECLYTHVTGYQDRQGVGWVVQEPHSLFISETWVIYMCE